MGESTQVSRQSLGRLTPLCQGKGQVARPGGEAERLRVGRGKKEGIVVAAVVLRRETVGRRGAQRAFFQRCGTISPLCFSLNHE